MEDLTFSVDSALLSELGEKLVETAHIALVELVKNAYDGVYVRYNGFRVYPYGEPGNDWLDIDADRGLRRGTVPDVLEGFAKRLRGVDPGRALLQLLSSRSHIGDVEIDARASGFQMKASREGFITHTAVDELKRLTRFLIDWATVYRDYFLRLIDKDESQTARGIRRAASHTC